MSEHPEHLNFDFSVFDWVALGSLAALLTVVINIVLVASIVIGVKSLKQGRKARNATLFVWTIEQMEEVKLDKMAVREADEDFHGWDSATLASAVKVANRFQRLGYAARSGLISQIHLREMFGVDFVQNWDKLKPWIVHLRLAEGEKPSAKEGAFLRKDFEFLAEEYREFYDKIRPGRFTPTMSDSVKRNLSTEIKKEVS